MYQPLGINHDFYRINLLLIKNHVIPRNSLLLGMVKSVPLARNPDIKSWKQAWDKVLVVIKQTNLRIPHMKLEKRCNRKNLAKAEVIVHHSKHREKKYHPHYRIVYRTVFAD